MCVCRVTLQQSDSGEHTPPSDSTSKEVVSSGGLRGSSVSDGVAAAVDSEEQKVLLVSGPEVEVRVGWLNLCRIETLYVVSP